MKVDDGNYSLSDIDGRVMMKLVPQLRKEMAGLGKFDLKKLGLENMQWPPAPNARLLLAYLHSGEVLRDSLPKLWRALAVIGFLSYLSVWLSAWPDIYEEFERWGLVKAFFARLTLLAGALLAFRFAMARAGQLGTLPLDEFITLRSMSILIRCFGEILLAIGLGFALSNLLQPVGSLLNSLLGTVSPALADEVSKGTPLMLLASVPISTTLVFSAILLFVFLYALAAIVELALAIEFNTRAERS